MRDYSIGSKDFKPLEQNPKPVLSLKDAVRAVKSDKLATIYKGPHKVFVVTAFGNGTFSHEEWSRAFE